MFPLAKNNKAALLEAASETIDTEICAARCQNALFRSIATLKSSSSFRDSVMTETTDATNMTLISAARSVKPVSMA